jgi:hypothetical protein
MLRRIQPADAALVREAIRSFSEAINRAYDEASVRLISTEMTREKSAAADEQEDDHEKPD